MKYPSVYRMVSDGQDCALGINGKYQIIAIRVEDQTAAIYRDTEMTLPVLFYETATEPSELISITLFMVQDL